jgi:hypothetical protein
MINWLCLTQGKLFLALRIIRRVQEKVPNPEINHSLRLLSMHLTRKQEMGTFTSLLVSTA